MTDRVPDPTQSCDQGDLVRRKRLKFRSWHRGTKEADLLLGSFAERHLDRLDPDQLAQYEALLDAEDVDLWDWLIGKHDPPPAFDTPVFALIRAHRFVDPSA